MRIVLLTLDFPPQIGGVQKYLYEIACRLGHSHPLTVVTPVQGPLQAEVPFRVQRLRVGRAIDFLLTLRRLDPERILVGHAHPRLLVPAALGGWGRYATIAYGNDYLAAQKRWHHPVFNWLLAHSRPLITVSEANARKLGCLGLSGAVVVRPGVDPARFHARNRSSLGSLTLLTVGRLVPRKGVDAVLNALPSLIGEFLGLRYVIVGDGPERQRLERLAVELNVETSVDFLGSVSDSRLRDVYSKADVFLMPVRESGADSTMEGFGIVYLEASASGLPVIAGRSGGATEAVREGETGLIVPPDDPQALANALRKLLQDPDLRCRMGQMGRTWVQEEMNWDRAARQMERALEA